MLDFLIGNDVLSAVVAFGLVLIPAVFIHELGHFLAAKAVGITILEFGIGFPPRIVTLFRRGETEYTLNWLPIGGFVRPLGEDFVRPMSDEAVARDRELLESRVQRSFNPERAALEARGTKTMAVSEARPLARIFFMAAGSSANLITALVLFVIIGLIGLPTIVGGSAGIVQLDTESAFAEIGLQTGDLIQQVNNQYIAGATAFTEILANSPGELITLTVLRLDEEEPFELSMTAPAEITLDHYVYIASIAPDSPAASASLQADDMIVAFNGQSFESFDDLPVLTQQHLGEEITLTVLRDRESIDVTLVPRADPPEGEGNIGIGIFPAYHDLTNGVVLVEGGFQQALVPLTLGDSIRYSFERIGLFLQTMASLPGELLSGQMNPEEARFVSPLGISQFGALFLQRSIEQDQPVDILNFIAIISIALGVTNLLPLPALDGGRIMFVLLEIVRGRPIAPEREGLVHLIGMALLLSLMAITFINDIVNPITASNIIP